MTRMAKKVAVKRVRKIVEKPDATKNLTKREVTLGAGRVQTKVDAIVKNHTKSLATAQARIDGKYKALLDEEVVGLHPDVLSALELPAFATAGAPAESDEGVDIEDLADDAVVEIAAQ